MSATVETTFRIASPRLAPLEPPHAPAVAERLARQMGRSPHPPLALFRLFARDEALATAMEPFGRFNLSSQAALPRRDRELVILRVCARCHAEYEWGVHVTAFGASIDLTSAQVRASVHGMPDDACWSPRDRAVLAMVDELHDTGDASDATWAALAEHLDETQRLQLLLLAGWYHAIAFACNAARLPLETWAERFPPAGPAD